MATLARSQPRNGEENAMGDKGGKKDKAKNEKQKQKKENDRSRKQEEKQKPKAP